MDEKQVCSQNIDMCMNMFNILVKDITQFISGKFSSDITLRTYSDIINKIIKETPDEIISGFILYIYSNAKYRANIEEGNDDFFLNNEYSEVGQNKIRDVFNFKKYWKDLTTEHRKYIKDTMKTLVEVCERYIESRSRLSKL